MAADLVPLMAGGAIIGYVLVEGQKPMPPTNVLPGGYVAGSGAASPGRTQQQAVVMRALPIGSILGRLQAEGYVGKNSTVGGAINTSGGGNYISNSQQQVQSVLDTASSYGEAAYNNLDDAAKQAGAAALSDQLNIDPPLKGDETWKEIAQVAGASAGAAVAGAACAPVGLTAVCGPLGAMLGSYLGAKLEDWLNGNVDDVKNWFSSKWGDIESWVSGTASDIGNKAEDYYNDAANYIGGLF